MYYDKLERVTYMNVLIVEDESLMALELANSISNYGYNVIDYVTTPELARNILKEEKIDLLILDINLNHTTNGIDLYKEIGKNIAVIYLTAYKDDKTISEAINTQPLGYLIKPHNEGELLALLKLADSKVTPDSNIIYLGEGYSFDQLESKLYLNDKFIKLSPKELKLLILLLEAKPNIVTFQTIEYELWDVPPNASTLRTLIYRLRNKLDHKFISTQNSHGIKIDF